MVKTDFKITVALSELKAFIKGGNLVEGFQNEIKISGYGRDLDITLDQQNQQNKIKLQWECLSIINN